MVYILQLSLNMYALLSVLAMAYGPSMNDLVFVGFVGIIDPPRDGIKEAVTSLTSGGVSVKMLTGDAEETAKTIGARLGLYSAGGAALSGDQIDNMDDHRLESVINDVAVFYRTTPRHKLKIIKVLYTTFRAVNPMIIPNGKKCHFFPIYHSKFPKIV